MLTVPKRGAPNQDVVSKQRFTASFTASVPGFESPLSLGYLRRTLATNVKLLLFISEDRSPFDAALTGKGFLVGVLATILHRVGGVARSGRSRRWGLRARSGGGEGSRKQWRM